MGFGFDDIKRGAIAVVTMGASEIPRIVHEAGNIYGEISGGNAAAAAAQRAAEERAAMAGNMRLQALDAARGYETQIMDLSRASPQEIMAHEQSLAAADKQLKSDERMLAAVDPNFLEASRQLLAHLRGDNTSDSVSIDGYKAQIADQRNQLIQSLQQQYGPGAETSSIGLKALRQFDLQSSAQLAQVGQQLRAGDQAYRINNLSSLGNIMGQQSSLRPDLMRSGMNYTNLAGIFRNRELAARQNSGNMVLNAMNATSGAMVDSAGAQYVGEIQRAKNQQGFLNTAITTAASLYGGGIGGAAAGAATRKLAADSAASSDAGGGGMSPMYSSSANNYQMNTQPYSAPQYATPAYGNQSSPMYSSQGSRYNNPWG